jgi:hypothetical protein
VPSLCFHRATSKSCVWVSVLFFSCRRDNRSCPPDIHDSDRLPHRYENVVRMTAGTRPEPRVHREARQRLVFETLVFRRQSGTDDGHKTPPISSLALCPDGARSPNWT